MRILVLYHHQGSYPLRATISEHLHAFRRYSGARCTYVNLAMRGLPDLDRVRPDLIVLHTILLSAARWSPALYEGIARVVEPLATHEAVKIALPQDEFYATDSLCDLLRRAGVDHVFSVAPPSEWPKIYRGLDLAVRLDEVLTGYVDDEVVQRLSAVAGRAARPVDVGYRAWHAAPWLGRHGQLKTAVADHFSRAAREHRLISDISTRPQDTFLGDDWYRFLERCRWVLGVEGGASVLDRDGTLRTRTDAYVAANPAAAFETVEAACFPGRDGELALTALSPRQLEACITRTGQILVEGRYNGLLEPDRHYLAVRKDFSNVDEVADRSRDERLRRELVERAYEDVVSSRRATYREFVRFVLSRALGDRRAGAPLPLEGRAALLRADLDDAVDWATIAVGALPRRYRVEERLLEALGMPVIDRNIMIQRVLDSLPRPLSASLRAVKRWTGARGRPPTK